MDTHTTAPNRYVEANNIRYAYRRFGAEKGVLFSSCNIFEAEWTIGILG
jgi:hypothetical protein